MLPAFVRAFACLQISILRMESALQEAQADAGKLLVDIYRQIEEPDSIYAVTSISHAWHDMAGLLPLLEHEGRSAPQLLLQKTLIGSAVGSGTCELWR